MQLSRSGEDAEILRRAVGGIHLEGMVAPSLLIKALCLFVSVFFLRFLSQLLSLLFRGDKHRCAMGAAPGGNKGKQSNHFPA